MRWWDDAGRRVLVVAMTVAGTVGALATGAPAGAQDAPSARVDEALSGPDAAMVLVPQHAGARPLEPSAFRLVVGGAEHPAADVTRTVDAGLDLVLLLDTGRLDTHLTAAKGAAAELLLQLPPSTGVVVWGASAGAPPEGIGTVPPTEALPGLGALGASGEGDLGATLEVLSGQLGPERYHAALVLSPEGDHTATLGRVFTLFDGGFRLVELDRELPAEGLDVLAALDGVLADLLGSYVVGLPEAGGVSAVVVDVDGQSLSVPLGEAPGPGTSSPDTTGAPAATAAGRPASEGPAPDAVAPDSVAVPEPVVVPGASPPSGDLSGRLAIGAALALGVALVGYLLWLRMRPDRRPISPPEIVPDDGGVGTARTLDQLYGTRPGGAVADASRLLAVVEIAAAARLDGRPVGTTEIRDALVVPSDGVASPARRWVDALLGAIADASGSDVDAAEALGRAATHMGFEAEAVAAARSAVETADGPAELHAALVARGGSADRRHRLAALGLAVTGPHLVRPAPLPVSLFLGAGPGRGADVERAAALAVVWHDDVRSRMRRRHDGTGADDDPFDPAADPVRLVAALLDHAGRHHGTVATPRLHHRREEHVHARHQ